MNSIFYKKEYLVPGEWNELDRWQMLRVMRVLYKATEETKGRLLLLRTLMKLPWWKFFNMKSPGLIEAAEEATQFLLEDNNLTKNILLEYRGWYGPSNNMTNLKMAEFCFSEAFLAAYKSSKKMSDLEKLIAVIYRPRRKQYDFKLNPEGDFRQPFNPHLLDYFTLVIQSWPEDAKYAILHFYEGCRNEKIKRNPKVFEGGSGEDSLFGMWSVMRNVAKAGHFGDFDKVGEQYVDTVLMELNEVVVEAEKMEDEMRRNKINA